MNSDLSKYEEEYIVDLIMEWIRRNIYSFFFLLIPIILPSTQLIIKIM